MTMFYNHEQRKQRVMDKLYVLQPMTNNPTDKQLVKRIAEQTKQLGCFDIETELVPLETDVAWLCQQYSVE